MNTKDLVAFGTPRNSTSSPRMALALALVLGTGASTTGCKPKMDPNAIDALLLPQGSGLFANIELGSTWEAIVAARNPKLVVRDDRASDGAPLRQLRHDLGSSWGKDGFFLTFAFDKDNKLSSYDVSVYGQKQNRAAVATIASRIRLHLTARLGPTKCTDDSKLNSEYCTWVGKPGTFGARYHYMKPTQDGDGGTIKVTVSRDGAAKQ